MLKTRQHLKEYIFPNYVKIGGEGNNVCFLLPPNAPNYYVESVLTDFHFCINSLVKLHCWAGFPLGLFVWCFFLVLMYLLKVAHLKK